jgi:GGDEF domain-containing protein
MLPDHGQLPLFEQPASTSLPGIAAPRREIVGKDEAHERLEAEFVHARDPETGSPLSVIIADVNALKAVNDVLGHEDGDELIDMVQSVITTVVKTLRTRELKDPDGHPEDNHFTPDIVSVEKINYEGFEEDEDALEQYTGLSKGTTTGRVGGDEFLIILPNTDEAGAARVVERINEAIQTYLSGPQGNVYAEHGISVGLSVGAATLTPDIESPSDLLRKADERMYEHKMSQIRPLTPKEKAHLEKSLAHLMRANVRPRDLPRYIEWLGEKGLEHVLSLQVVEEEASLFTRAKRASRRMLRGLFSGDDSTS